ncbi:glutamate-rich protein 3 isoform X1 [Sebastes fasciatus]|uniref:glutamate-rich protein 3 isoform X1 n=2 Tax=Sebastes fasciatus TaxID=394691 RepID=UPI003D9F1C1B
MSHLSPGLISAYNSLTDRHLAGYFSNSRIRRHLQRAGLITRSGRIVPDKEYRHKLIQRAHQRHIRECLAQAIFHKVLEMERVHQIEIKRKLEEFARRERVHKIKVDRSKRYEEEIIRILSPRPPTGARGIRKQHSGPEGEHSESSESPGSSRPNTAPGKMQRPVRLKPIHSNSTTASLRRSSPYRLLESSNENDQPLNCTMDKESQRRRTTTEVSSGISPYVLPVINNFVTPVPPTTKRKERGVKVTPSGTLRGRRLRPTTASSGVDVNEDPPMLRSSVHQSRVCVSMMYFGKTVHLSHDMTDMRDEVKVFQQHCGGENLCVFKGKLREGETFQFISRRHRGFPFSLTFFLNGLQVERLSSCCEFKHRKGSRLGGRHGHFGFCSVEGASPCYKCIIAMGLDKKPTPPPKRVKEDGGREESVPSPKDAPEMETERTGDEAASHSECETRQPQDMETQVEEETAAEEDKVRDDYEEDFEADDEDPAEDAEAKEKKSSSPSGETATRVKERDASESEDDEKDEDIKSRSGSSSSGSDREESDAEATKDSREDEKAEQPEVVTQEETAVPPDERKDEPQEAAVTEVEPAAPKDSDIQDSAGDSTEIDVSDTSVPSGNEKKQSDDTSGDKEVEKTVDESKQEEEPERAKSVQEKLAEAILKESQCSSEPELSDTSTEEEEESADKGPEQDSKDEVAVKSVTFTEQQQTLVEETKCEEGVGEAEVVQGHEATPEPKEQEDQTEQELHENGDAKDEKVKIEEEDEKAASEEDKNTAENDKSVDAEDTVATLHPVSEDDKTSEPQEEEEAAAKSADGDAAEKDAENEEKTAAEADETGQGAKSSEQDESSVSEPDKKTDETAATDNAEAQAMTASETMEMKAEPSEEREALDCEEAPVTDTEEKQRGDSEDRDRASETEVIAENSSSSLEGSGDTTVEKTAVISEDNAKDESIKDDIKEEELSAVEASKDDDLGEEQTEKSSVGIDDKIEEKCDEESKEEGKQTNPDEITEGENKEESEKEDKDKTEEEENNETGERTENILELTKSDSNTEGKENEEQAEKTHSEEDKVTNEEKADESEKTKRDEECVENKNEEEEAEEKGATTDQTNEGEKINTADDEEKDDDAEKEEKEDNVEKVAKTKDDEESEEKKVVTDTTADGEEISEITEKSEKSAEADLDKDGKISEENIVESEDVADSEAANVAHGTKTTEEMSNKETEGGNDSEKGEVDVENGELSSEAKNKTLEDEGEAQTEGKDDVKTADDERKTEEPTEGASTEVKEVTVESGDGAEKLDKVDESPDTDVVQSEGKERDDGVEKQDESPKNDSEPETSGTKIQEESTSDDRKDGETKQDENGNISDPHDENRDSDLMNNVQSNVIEVMVASSADQAQTSTPTAVDSDNTGHKLDESTAPSDSNTDKHPRTDENAAALDLSEEASKASEEGASVLLKPQAQSSQLTQKNDAVGEEPPEALATEDNTDLVTNWVTMHQTSKYFETFVEPLEDLKESTSDDSNEGATRSTELPRLESPLKIAKVSENPELECTPKDVNESRDKSKEEAVVSNLESNYSEDSEKDTLQVEETEVKDLIPKTESEQNDKESEVRSEEHKGSMGEDRVQEGLMQDNSEQTDVSKTEVESIAGTHHSVASGRPESVKIEEKTTDLNEKQTSIEEVKDLLPSSKTEEPCERPTSPEGLNELKETEETWEKSDLQSREVTEITVFTTSKSDDGSQEESHHKDIQPSEASINGDKREVQLIQDIKHTLSKDRLSSFSVDETLFGPSSYPVLTAARTESGH